MTERSAAEKDRLILELRRKGYTYAQIGKALGMSKTGVRYALVRMQQGRSGRATR
jgi:DNA-binding CsgD family transcriptional regulator